LGYQNKNALELKRQLQLQLIMGMFVTREVLNKSVPIFIAKWKKSTLYYCLS